ncbi:MAG: heat shock protein transcriptional repressor HspR [Sphingomonadaceae bacterium]
MNPRDPRNGAEQEPCFVISVAAKLVNVHQQTLRYYERLGLLEPGRSQGNIRLYSMRDIQRAQQIRRLIEELGVNLAGVEVILNMTERINELEQRMVLMREQYEAEIRRLRAMLGEAT